MNHETCSRCAGAIIMSYNRRVCSLCSREPALTYRKAVRADGRYKAVLLPGDDGYEEYAEAPPEPVRSQYASRGNYSDDEVRAMRASGLSNKELAAIYGGTANMVAKLRRGQTYSWVDPGVNLRGKNDHRKLFDDEVIKIRNSKKTGRELARQYGVSAATISGILSRRLYADVAAA